MATYADAVLLFKCWSRLGWAMLPVSCPGAVHARLRSLAMERGGKKGGNFGSTFPVCHLTLFRLRVLACLLASCMSARQEMVYSQWFPTGETSPGGCSCSSHCSEQFLLVLRVTCLWRQPSPSSKLGKAQWSDPPSRPHCWGLAVISSVLRFVTCLERLQLASLPSSVNRKVLATDIPVGHR